MEIYIESEQFLTSRLVPKKTQCLVKIDINLANKIILLRRTWGYSYSVQYSTGIPARNLVKIDLINSCKDHVKGDGKEGKTKFADVWERTSAITRRQGTNRCGREQSLVSKIECCNGRRVIMSGRSPATRNEVGRLAADWLAAKNGS